MLNSTLLCIKSRDKTFREYFYKKNILTSTLQEEPFDPKISTKLRYIGDILNVDTSAFFYDDFLCWRLLTKWMTFVYRLKGLKMYGTDREADIVQGVKRSGGY